MQQTAPRSSCTTRHRLLRATRAKSGDSRRISAPRIHPKQRNLPCGFSPPVTRFSLALQAENRSPGHPDLYQCSKRHRLLRATRAKSGDSRRISAPPIHPDQRNLPCGFSPPVTRFSLALQAGNRSSGHPDLYQCSKRHRLLRATRRKAGTADEYPHHQSTPDQRNLPCGYSPPVTRFSRALQAGKLLSRAPRSLSVQQTATAIVVHHQAPTPLRATGAKAGTADEYPHHQSTPTNVISPADFRRLSLVFRWPSKPKTALRGTPIFISAANGTAIVVHHRAPTPTSDEGEKRGQPTNIRTTNPPRPTYLPCGFSPPVTVFRWPSKPENCSPGHPDLYQCSKRHRDSPAPPGTDSYERRERKAGTADEYPHHQSTPTNVISPADIRRLSPVFRGPSKPENCSPGHPLFISAANGTAIVVHHQAPTPLRATRAKAGTADEYPHHQSTPTNVISLRISPPVTRFSLALQAGKLLSGQPRFHQSQKKHTPRNHCNQTA